MLLCQFAIASLPQDSIGFTKENGKFYVKYLVEPGETIYRISTKYGIPVSDLLEEKSWVGKRTKSGSSSSYPLFAYKTSCWRRNKRSISYCWKIEKLLSISKKLNIPVGDLLKMNNIELHVQKIVVSRQSSVASGQSTTSKPKEEKKEEDLSFNSTQLK